MVSRSDAIDAAFAQVEDAWGPVEVLVANAGAGASGRIERTSDEDWQRARANIEAQNQKDRAQRA